MLVESDRALVLYRNLKAHEAEPSPAGVGFDGVDEGRADPLASVVGTNVEREQTQPSVFTVALSADADGANWAAIDRAYVDLDAKTLARVEPTPAFRVLVTVAARRTKRCRAAIEVIA